MLLANIILTILQVYWYNRLLFLPFKVIWNHTLGNWQKKKNHCPYLIFYPLILAWDTSPVSGSIKLPAAITKECRREAWQHNIMDVRWVKRRFCEKSSGSYRLKDRWFTARCQGGVDDISEAAQHWWPGREEEGKKLSPLMGIFLGLH